LFPFRCSFPDQLAVPLFTFIRQRLDMRPVFHFSGGAGGNLPAHRRDLLFQSLLRHKERTQQVPTQVEKVGNRLE
jgi:hypothetical protein